MSGTYDKLMAKLSHLSKLQGEQRRHLVEMASEKLAESSCRILELQPEIKGLLGDLGGAWAEPGQAQALRRAAQRVKENDNNNMILAKLGIGIIQKLRGMVQPAPETNRGYDRRGQSTSQSPGCSIMESA